MTTPSSTMATCLPTVAAVRSVNFFCPPLVKVTPTCHWFVPAGSSRAVAPLTSVPTTVAGASRYLALPSRSHATVSSVGLSTLLLPCRFAGWEQSRAAKATASGSVAAPDAGRRRWRGARRRWRRARRRWRGARRRWRRCGGRGRTRRGDGRRRDSGAGRRLLDHFAEAQLGGAAELLRQLSRCAGHRDDDVLALGDHLGLGHADAVDPLPDDVDRLL